MAEPARMPKNPLGHLVVFACASLSALWLQGCLPDPDRELARYQRDALAYAESASKAYGDQWEAGLVGLWEGVRAAVVYVASEDEQEWSRRWPGLVPMRASMSPQDTLLVLQPPVATGPDQVRISARLFLGGEWTTHSIGVLRGPDGWQAIGETTIDRN